MGMFYGPIGFVETVEDPVGSGIWIEKPIERNYRGEVSRFSKRWDNGSQQVNPDITITNTISIIADPFVSNKLYALRYIKWLGGYWNVSSVDVQLPRLILSIGGVYNGPTVESSGTSGEHPRIS
jgi:hypothetical protein